MARTSDKPLAEVAAQLGISRSCLQNWIRQARVDAGDGAAVLSTAERAELRRRNRQLEMENEVLKRATAYFAQENALPK